jgi:hypothetical protein
MFYSTKKKYYDQSFTGVRNHWKIIFKNKKNIILIYFRMKNTLKNNHNYTLKNTSENYDKRKKED